MRVFLFSLVLFLHQTSSAQNTPSAEKVLAAAFRKAGQEGKKIFLIFKNSSCGWCYKMDASLQDKSIQPAIYRSYEIVHLTVKEIPAKKNLENPGALAFLKKNGGADMGVPYWYVLDEKGKILANAQYQPGKNTGCPAAKEEVDYFIQVLKKTSLLSEEELQRIAQRFRLNETIVDE